MNRERINSVLSDFKAALVRLEEALDEELSKGSIVVDGTIQRFEFTFELAWKLTGQILKYQGINAQAPRMVIKEGFSAGFLSDGEAWIDMLEDRNKTSHIYDEAQALKVYEKIRDNHFPVLEAFSRRIEDFIKSM